MPYENIQLHNIIYIFKECDFNTIVNKHKVQTDKKKYILHKINIHVYNRYKNVRLKANQCSETLIFMEFVSLL